MISLREMSKRLQAKWERAFRTRAIRRKPVVHTDQCAELFESRQMLSASAIGSAAQLNPTDTGVVSTTDVDRISDGRSVVAWRENVGEEAKVLAQRFDAAGVAVGGVIEVAEDFAGDSVPAVAMADDGQFVVVWVDDDSSIVGRQFNADGTAKNDEFDIATVTVEDLGVVVDVDMDADGDFVVVWAAGLQRASMSTYETMDESAVFGRRYSKAGAPVDAEFRVDTPPTGTDIHLVAHPMVAVDADGDFVIGWTDIMERLVTKTKTEKYSGETYTYEYEVLELVKASAMIRMYQGMDFTQPAVAKAAQLVLTTTKPQTVVNLQDVDMDADGDVLVTMSRDAYKSRKVRYSGSTYEYMQFRRGEMLVQRFTASGGKSGKLKKILKSKKTEQASIASTSLDKDGDFTVTYKVNTPASVSVSSYDAGETARVTRHQAGKKDKLHKASKKDSRKKEPDEIPDKLLALHFSTKNKKDGDPFQLLTTDPGSLQSFAVAGQGAGELTAVWTLNAEASKGKLFGIRVKY